MSIQKEFTEFIDRFKAEKLNSFLDFLFLFTCSAQAPLSCCKTTNPHRYPDAIEELYFVNITGCLSNPTDENANLGVSNCIDGQRDINSLLIFVTTFLLDRID